MTEGNESIGDRPVGPALGLGRRIVGSPVLVYAALAAAFTAATIRYSRHYGPMLVSPRYDDVVYLNEGLLYAQIAQLQGLWAVVRYAILHVPHSPFATGTAMLSFLLVGPAVSAPYALMGVGVLVVAIAADRLLVGNLSEADCGKRLRGQRRPGCLP